MKRFWRRKVWLIKHPGLNGYSINRIAHYKSKSASDDLYRDLSEIVLGILTESATSENDID